MTLAGFLRDNAPFLSAGALLTFLSSFGQTFFISVFAGEIRAEFGLSHGGWGAVYSAATFASAGVMIWAGVLTDRFRARALGLWVAILLAAAALTMAAAQSVAMLVLAVFLLRLAGQGMAFHIAIVAMARWYVALRGRAISIASLGVAAGEAFLPLTAVGLMALVDWRLLWVGAAVLSLATVPLLLRLLRLERTPQSLAEDMNSAGLAGRHWTRRDLFGHGLFWFVLPSILAPSAFSTAFFFHQVHLAEVKGWSHGALVALFPLFTASAIAALILSGWLIDRLGAMRLMPFVLVPMAAGFAILSNAEPIWLTALAMALMGASQGANSAVPAAFWAEAYGTRHLGAIKSLATAIMVFGTAIGPVLTGVLIDGGLPFADQMLWIAAYFLVSAGLVGVGVARARRLSAQTA
ncbi:MAG: MFS transporter [Paracoccaceae bacterium]|nr:MFS transporter [Paracoccaceae bacterium]